MDKPIVKGDEVRHGAHLYLDALSKEIIETLADVPLSEPLLYQLNQGDAPISLATARQVAQSYSESDGLVFALRLNPDNTCIGVCQLGDLSWTSRHAQLQISIVDEAALTHTILADALQTILQFAFWEANLNRIYVHCVEDNTLLRDVLDHAGFTNEGGLRQEVYRDGRYLNKFIYSILQREW